MQSTLSQPAARERGRGAPRPSFKGIVRSVRYLTHHGREAALPYLFLIVATLSQLAVPRMIRNVIDAVTSGYIADQVLKALEQIPANFVGAALPRILEALNYDPGLTYTQLVNQLNADVAQAPRSLIAALAAIVGFALLRGLFAFLQAYWAEKNCRLWLMTCATTCTPKSKTCRFHTTIKTRPVN
jgi:ATP-binding cassette subfamily B protein